MYACYAMVDGVRYKAAVNVGIPATFADTAKENIEVHILDFDEDIYGQPIEVEFMRVAAPHAHLRRAPTSSSPLSWATSPGCGRICRG